MTYRLRARGLQHGEFDLRRAEHELENGVRKVSIARLTVHESVIVVSSLTTWRITGRL